MMSTGSHKEVGFTCSKCDSWNFIAKGSEMNNTLLTEAKMMMSKGTCRFCDVPNAPTTDEIDKISVEERKKLVGYCEEDDYFTHFTLGKSRGKCEKCGGKFSQLIGFQLQTQRTFNPEIAKKKKRIKK